jgi:hypothetical protein
MGWSLATPRRRAGRLAAAGLAAALLLGGSAAAEEAVDLELVLAADGSGSIDDDEFRLQRAGYAAAITNPRVLGAIRSGFLQRIALAYMEWGAPESQATIVGWALIHDQASAQAFAERLLAAPRVVWGYNSISAALDYAAGMIHSNDYEGTRKIIDISGDGPQIGGRPIQAARGEAVFAGITINALVIVSAGGGYPGPGGMPLDAHYRGDVIGGAGAFVMTADSRASFAEAILNKLVLEMAGAGVPGEVARARGRAGRAQRGGGSTR